MCAVASSCFPHPISLYSIWTDLKRSGKIPGAPAWRWGEWIWLIGHSGLHRVSPQGLNISSIRFFDQIRDLETQSPFAPMCVLHDAKIKEGKKLLTPMLWVIKENTIHGVRLISLTLKRSPEQNGKCRLSCPSPWYFNYCQKFVSFPLCILDLENIKQRKI